MGPTFFATPADLRAWFERHHADTAELVVGFYKKGTGRPSVTWPDSVDQALCFGWIDGVRRRVDDESYTIRFTPRKRGSTWSAVNIARAGELIAEGAMQPAGQAAFGLRTEARSRTYAYEQDDTGLDSAYEARFRAEEPAWAFFSAQPPSYRRTATWWVMSAKRTETRQRRLATLIDDSANGRRLARFTR